VNTSAPTSLSTDTPQPSLSAEEAKALVFGLLKDNGGCQFPCLWGLTPEKTDNQTFSVFISQFSPLVSPDVYMSVDDFGNVGGFTFSYRENNIHTVADFSYYKNTTSAKLDLLNLRGYAMKEQGNKLDWLNADVTPLYGDASFNRAFEYYLLPQILSKYGRPSQVLLAPFPDEPQRPDIQWYPFSLVLLYPEKGIFVEYVSPREKVGNNFVGCPSKASISLAVWNPASNLSLKYVVQKAGFKINEVNMDYFRPVEKATLMTLDQFYQTFKNPGNTTCVETPQNLWQP